MSQNDQTAVLIISFVVFFLPSLFVFLYKLVNRKYRKKHASFWPFMFTEYISIFIILGIMLLTIFGVKQIDKSRVKTIDKFEQAKRHKDYKALEYMYADELAYEPFNQYYIHQKIYYHFKRDKKLINKNGDVYGVRSDHKIKRFFEKYDNYSDTTQQKVWPLYLFLSNYFEGNYGDAHSIYQDYNISDFKYVNFYLAELNWNHSDISRDFYLKEIENDGFVTRSYQNLAWLYLHSGNTKAVEDLINGPESRPHLSKQIGAQWAFQEGHYYEFIKLKYQIAFEGITLAGFIAAFIILAMWFVFFYKLDLFEKEKINLLIFTVLFSAAITNLCLLAYAYVDTHLMFDINGDPLNDLMYSIFVIGLIEEITKLIPFLVVFLIFRKEFNEPFDYILFMVMSALGFAFEENMMYFDAGSTHTFSARAIYSSIGHMFFSATIAYGIILGIYKYSNWKKVPVIPIFFGLSITGHGLFDYLLFHNHHYLFVFFFLLITKIFIQYINNALNNSDYFDYKVDMQTINLRQIIAIGISLVFALEYIYTSWYYSVPLADNLAFDLRNYSSFFVMIFIADHFSHYNLIKGEWRVLKFNLNSFDLHKEEENFVGKNIILRNPLQTRKTGLFYNQLPIKAHIANRISIKHESIWLKNKDIQEKGWFVLELEEAINTNYGLQKEIIINFTSKSVTLLKKEDAFAMIPKSGYQIEELNPKNQFLILGRVQVENND
jgi:RsiW-degrading membrane proteinase PrsW (M82 family)